MKFLGIDIGGANIKVADAGSYSATFAFPLWREPGRLQCALGDCLAAAPRHDAIAATTTGELADCFATKREGISAIYGALVSAATGRGVYVYLTDGRFVAPGEAIAAPQLAAASNWHALAAFAAGCTTGREGLLIDVGSTTTDIIPIRQGQPAAQGRTDTERLLHGELVYTGATRTPVGMLASALPWRGELCPIAREVFATTLDAHVLLGNIPADPSNTKTADGRPATRIAARCRLARMVGADCTTFDDADALACATVIAATQQRMIAAAVTRVTGKLGSLQTAVLSGEGEFLAEQALDEGNWSIERISLTRLLGARMSQAAAAHAVAVLASTYQATGNAPPRAVKTS